MRYSDIKAPVDTILMRVEMIYDELQDLDRLVADAYDETEEADENDTHLDELQEAANEISDALHAADSIRDSLRELTEIL